MEIVGGTQEYSAKANWKMLQENSADGYHGAPTHATYFDYLKARDGTERNVLVGSVGWVENPGNGPAGGESIGERAWGPPYAGWVPGWAQGSTREAQGIAKQTYARAGDGRGQFGLQEA